MAFGRNVAALAPRRPEGLWGRTNEADSGEADQSLVDW